MASKQEKRIHNTVHDDEIWKQTINYELTTAKNWENNWGFIRTAYLKHKPATKNEGTRLPPLKAPEPFSSGLPAKLAPGLSKNPNSIIKDWLCTYDINGIIKYRFPAGKYFYPSTTSSEVGWPWGRAAEMGNGDEDANDLDYKTRACKSKHRPKYYSLEMYNTRAAGRGDPLKWLGGTRESLP